jgi:hypothetical protein
LIFKITRERHLDHMVKVVPFIVVCYAIQSYVILQTSTSPIGQLGLMILGLVLASMITCFVTYDLNHQVEVFEDYLIISFLGRKTVLPFSGIGQIEISHPGESFSKFSFKCSGKKYRFYFIDDAEKLKSWIEEHSLGSVKAA